MLQFGVVPLLSETNPIAQPADYRHCSSTDTPFIFTPQRIHFNKDHEFFEDGDIHRHLYVQNTFTFERDDSPKLSVSEFGCHISGCNKVFRSVEEYEHHYNSLHRHVCCSCRRSLPSAHLLDIHIQEWHDSLFAILAQNQDMYQCLVEGCEQRFRTSKQRKDHLIRIHKYPPDFRFDNAKKHKGTKEVKNQGPRRTNIEAVCEVWSDQPEDEEAMDLHVPQQAESEASHPNFVSSEAHIEPSAVTHGNTSISSDVTPRYTYRVPATICFGKGSVRGFRGRGRTRRT